MSSKASISRRKFLQNSSKVAAGVAVASTFAGCATDQLVRTSAPAAQIFGANERINMAIIGLRGRGTSHIKAFGDMPNVRIKTLCDPDGNILDERADEFAKKHGYRPHTEKDMRKVLEDKDIDAVAFATPNHWHALGTVWACQAGKHVYVEKPCSFNLWEGRKMVEAARKYNRIVEVGFQNRSIKNVRDAMSFLHNGGIGDVYMARGLCYKTRESIGTVKDGIGKDKGQFAVWGKKGVHYDQAYIDNVDYDLWTGPAKKQPFNYNRFHYNWHWNWNYGCGDIGNQGPHQLDVARWGLNKNEHPVTISSMGGFFGEPCDQQTPNTQNASFKYADGTILEFGVRGLKTNYEDGIRVGNVFYGTKGWMHVNGGNWKTYFGYGENAEPGPSNKEAGEFADPSDPTGAGGGGHFGNFIAALRGKAKLTCDILEGHYSTALAHLANVSYRSGKMLTFDGANEKVVGDAEANKFLRRQHNRAPYVINNNV